MSKTVDPKKPVELKLKHKIDNIWFALAWSSVVIVAAVWTVRMWFYSWRKWSKKHPGKMFRPMLPKVIDCWCIGEEPGTHWTGVVLKAYNIRYLVVAYQWEVQQNMIGMHVWMIVNPTLFDKADSVLFNAANGLWDIQTRPGNLRHVQFQQHNKGFNNERLPYTKRQAPPARKQAQLGKPYQNR